METRVFSAYNLARGVLLNSRLTLADSGNQPLKLLDIVISGMGMDSTSGLWLTPLHALPAVPRVFPFDLLYLDKDFRVLESASMGPGIDFPAFYPEVASALVLPSDVLSRTQTEAGDRLIICPSKDLEALLAAAGIGEEATQPLVPEKLVVASASTSSNGRSRTPKPGSDPVPASRPAGQPAIALENPILKAAENAAENLASAGPLHPPIATPARSQPEAQAPLKSETTSDPGIPPGPSIAVTEAVRERSLAPIVEHHVGPDDLFSNWVVTPASPPRPSVAPPRTPESRELGSSAQPESPAPAKNGKTKPARVSAPKPSTEKPALSAAPSSPEAKAKPAPAQAAQSASRQPALPSQQPQIRPPAAPAIPQTASLSTFTHGAHGMWQISPPTAAAPLTPKSAPPTGKSNPSTRASSLPSAAAAPKPAPVPAPTSPQRAAAPASQNPPEPRPVPKTPTPPAAPASAATAPPALSSSRPVSVQQPHTPPAAKAAQITPAQQPKPLDSQSKARPQAPLGQPAKPVLTPRPAPAKAEEKTTPSLGNLRAKFKQWLNPVSTPSDRRRASRRYVPGMVAHYFTGGAPKPHEIADISMSGMYLLTGDRWMPGTMIQMTLQKPCAQGERKQSMNVLSRIVRRGSDGVAIEFVMPEALSHIGHDIQPSQATDKFALARFL